MKKILDFLFKKQTVIVRFEYEGDKGKDQIHYTSFLHFNPSEDEFIINWDTKRVRKQKR